MLQDCPCMPQTLLNVKVVIALDDGAIIVVPEISLLGDQQSRWRSVLHFSSYESA